MQILLSIASTVCACLPMFFFLAAVWWLDRYDREPVWLLGLTFLWGAVGSILVAMVASMGAQWAVDWSLAAASPYLGADFTWAEAMSGPVLVAPLVEEPAKALILGYVIWNRHFDNMTDGFVYGAAAGLGFGMTENLLYFVSVSSDAATWGSTVLVRTFYSAVMHATATAVVGAVLGLARFKGCLTLIGAGLGGLGLAVLVHAVWNGLIALESLTGGTGEMFFYDLILLPAEVALVFLVFQICLLEESWTIRRELREEAAQGVLPAEHPSIIASWIRRLGRDWVPDGIDRDLYVQTATSLAMRKKQVRQMSGRAPEFYRDEVARLRRQLELLLRGA